MIRKMERSSGRNIGLEVSGKVALEQFEALLPEIEAAIHTHGTINLLCLVENMSGYGIKEFVADCKFAIKYWNNIAKVAIVGDSNWWALGAKIDNLFTKWEERFFDSGKLEEAWKWIEEPAEK